MNYRLYGRVVSCDRELSFHPCEAASDLVVEAGDVPEGGRCVHDVVDPGRPHRLRVFDPTTRPTVEYDGWRFGLSSTTVTYAEIGRHDSPFDLVVERVVVPLTRLLADPDSIALHGSSVVIDGQVIAFIGNSGAGKSTTARLLARFGAFASDDLTMIDGDLIAHPSAAGLRSWDALDSPGLPLYAGSDKLWYALPKPPPRSSPIGLVIHLRRGDRWAIARLRGTNSVVKLLANTFDLESPPPDWRSHRLSLASQLAREVPIVDVIYPANTGDPAHGEPLWERVKDFRTDDD